MKAELILLTPKNKDGEMETLMIYKDGKIICGCRHNLFWQDREINSICKHATKLRQQIIKGDIEEYEEVK